MFDFYCLSLEETVAVNVTCKRMNDYLYEAYNIKTKSVPTAKMCTKVGSICRITKIK